MSTINTPLLAPTSRQYTYNAPESITEQISAQKQIISPFDVALFTYVSLSAATLFLLLSGRNTAGISTLIASAAAAVACTILGAKEDNENTPRPIQHAEHYLAEKTNNDPEYIKSEIIKIA